MGSIVGADADALDQLAQVLASDAQRLHRTRATLGRQIASAPWHGANARHFRERWNAEYARALLEARAFLERAGEDLRAQADQQREASAADGAGGIGVVDFRDTWDRIKRFIRKLLGLGTPISELPVFDDGARPEDILQGSYGDCWLLSTLGAIVATPGGRALIEKMIRDNGDGTYTVTFADGTSVTVDDDRGSNNARCGKDKWPMIIEKAWKERYGDADLINGGSATEPFKGFGALGYKDVRMSWLQTDQAISDDELRKLLTSGRPMVASAEIGSVDQPPWDQTSGFDGGGQNGAHAFSVIDSSANTVTLRNPWGRNGSLVAPEGVTFNPDGTFTMTFDQFRKYFARIDHAAAP